MKLWIMVMVAHEDFPNESGAYFVQIMQEGTAVTKNFEAFIPKGLCDWLWEW